MSDSGSGFSWNLTPDPTPPAADQPPRRRGRRAEAAPEPEPTPPPAPEPAAEPAPRTLSELTGLPAIVPWTPPAASAPSPADASSADAAPQPPVPAAASQEPTTGDALSDLFGDASLTPAALTPDAGAPAGPPTAAFDPRPAADATQAFAFTPATPEAPPAATQAFTFAPAAPEAPAPAAPEVPADAATQAFAFPVTPATPAAPVPAEPPTPAAGPAEPSAPAVTPSEASAPAAFDPEGTQAFAFTPPTPAEPFPAAAAPASPLPASAPTEAPAPEPVSLDTGFAALGIFTSPAPVVEPEPTASAQPLAVAFPVAAAPVAATPPAAVAVGTDGRRSITPAKVTPAAPTGEIDSLFAEDNFRDVDANPPTTQMSERRAALDRAPAEPMTTTQKVLFWVAGGLLLALAIVAVFLVVNRLGEPTTREPTTPAASVDDVPVEPELPATGPLPAGEYGWDLLRGGECISPFESAWQDTFTVVDCATPHQAQLVSRGVLADAADAAFPKLEELQARITMMCTEPAVLNQELTASGADVRIVATFPVDAAAWAEGQRNYDCFALRVDGTDFTQSVQAG